MTNRTQKCAEIIGFRCSEMLLDLLRCEFLVSITHDFKSAYMIRPAYPRSFRYNALKTRALEGFAQHGRWLSPPEWAVLAGFYPTRASYSYLLRLHRSGLLERNCSGLLVYRLSKRGRLRLA
jgi:hypothetical protein